MTHLNIGLLGGLQSRLLHRQPTDRLGVVEILDARERALKLDLLIRARIGGVVDRTEPGADVCA